MPSPQSALIALLAALALHNGMLTWLLPPTGGQPLQGTFWVLDLYVIPLVLVGGLVANHRWPYMAAVVYATVGLALDIATFVYGLAHDAPLPGLLLSTGPSGLLNFLAIVVAGVGTVGTISGATLPADRLPNPRSQPST
ncbi:hypothetical protein YTPLAS18_13160 [Nitrospira sp.]|nr:hypothetical protein YTPLAS18_13160 [Nitrospira sp.]